MKRDFEHAVAAMAAKVDLVNGLKAQEECVLRVLEGLVNDPAIDPRWLAIGRTAIEQGFMAVSRAVFCPARMMLPEDVSGAGSAG